MKAKIQRQVDDRRREPRRAVDIDGTMRELGEQGADAKILNISEHGFMAASETHFDVGARVWLILPGCDRANAVVKWVAGDRLGAEFAEPIVLDGLEILPD